MGQARNRGSFEERKAQAIAAGRIKTANKKEKPTRGGAYFGFDHKLTFAEAMTMLAYAKGWKK